MSKRIAVVGSLNVDFVLNMQRFPAPGETVVGSGFSTHPGGKGANQAYAAGLLGGNVAMIGQVGNDAHAAWLKQGLSAAGVDVSGILTDPSAPTGVALIATDGEGQNQIVIVPGSNGTLDVERVQPALNLLASAKIVLLQLEIPLETVQAVARRAKEQGAVVILDPAPARALPAELLRSVDYLTPNETELAVLAGATRRSSLSRAEVKELIRPIQDAGARKIIVKMGAAGAMLVDGDSEQFWPAFAVKAVDSTAAGDAFNGAFAVALAEAQSEADAGRFAVAAAGFSVTRRGAQTSMPRREEVEELLRLSSR
jgi:ribokinase